MEEDLVDEREDLMVFPSSVKTHLLKTCFTTSTKGSQATVPLPDVKALPFNVSFNGWRLPHVKFKSWATKMSSLHEPTWKKAGILQAVAASTVKINKDSDLVMGVAERWSPETKTFLFPWGETTVTLEDVMVLLGFSVLGSPFFSSLDSSGGEEIRSKLEKEWVILKKAAGGRGITQPVWMRRFMDSGDELEHVAFLVLWLSYFVFPSSRHQINESVFSVAVHLSSGRKIALAPAVLAHLYADLTLLKDHTSAFTRSKSIELSALFKLVQVWTWERFKELRPRPYFLLEGQTRLARWDDVKQGDNDVRKILENSKINSFEWRPYTNATATVENWELPKFYPEKAMSLPIGPDLDEEFISFARCIKVSDLVGMDSVEHYFPNRVATQFGLLQDVPCPVNKNNLSEEEAWDEYNKPIDELTLYIPSRSATPRVTQTFCDWWKVSFPQLQRSLNETLKSSNTIGDLGPKKGKRRKRIRGNNDEEDASEPLCKKCRLASVRAHDVDKPEVEQRKETGCDETSPSRPPTSALGGESGIVASPPETMSSFDDGKNITLIDYVTKETECSLHEDGAIGGEKESSESLIHNDETGSRTGKNMVRSPVDKNNSYNPPFGFDDIFVSPPPETRQACDDEFDAHGSSVEKMTLPGDGNKEPECLLHEDGGMAEEKASSEEKEDDSSIQKKMASNTDNNKPSPCQNLAPGGSEVPDESKRNEDVGDDTQGHDCLFHDTVLGSEEPMKYSEQLEKRNEDAGANDSYEKSLHNVKALASSMEELALEIYERIAKAQKKLPWLKARRCAKQKKIAAAARLI